MGGDEGHRKRSGGGMVYTRHLKCLGQRPCEFESRPEHCSYVEISLVRTLLSTMCCSM